MCLCFEKNPLSEKLSLSINNIDSHICTENEFSLGQLIKEFLRERVNLWGLSL